MLHHDSDRYMHGVRAGLSAAKKPFIFLSLCILIAMIPLLAANFNYLDDLGRTAIGYRGWSNYSRYVSEYGSMLLHAGTYLTDISPLPQMLAACMLAAAGVLVVFSLQREAHKGVSFFTLIAVLPLALSPYFLECLSYKFDSPYMAFSILISIVPVWVYKVRGTGALFCLSSMLGALLMCLSYQAASGLYPMLIVLIAFSLWNQRRTPEALRLIAQAAPCYLAGLLIFHLVCMPEIDSYASTSILPLPQLIPGFLAQLLRYARLILSDFKRPWLLLTALVFLCYIGVCVRDSARHRLLAFFMASATLFAAFTLAFGVYPALTSPLEDPRAMFGFGAMIAFVAVCAVVPEKTAVPRLCAFALSWCFFTFSFTYGNALIEQKRFAETRIQLVLQDLNQLPLMNNGVCKTVAIRGDVGFAPVVGRIPGIQHLLSRLLPTLFSGRDWGENYIYCFYGIPDIVMLEDASHALDDIDIDQLNLPVLQDTLLHTIRGNHEYVLIDLKSR